MTALFYEVLQTGRRSMTREQYLHYEDLLELFRSPRDVEDELRRKKARNRPKNTCDRSLRALYYQCGQKRSHEVAGSA
jgi:hypothetical protein